MGNGGQKSSSNKSRKAINLKIKDNKMSKITVYIDVRRMRVYFQALRMVMKYYIGFLPNKISILKNDVNFIGKFK